MALGEKRNGSVFATAAQRRDAAEYQVTSEPEVVPVVVDDTPQRTLNTDIGTLGRAHNLFFTPSAEGRDFNSVLQEVQEYISGAYAALITEGGEDSKEQLMRYITKYLQDQRIAVAGMTQTELVDAIYSEMAEFGFLTRYIYADGIEEININSWRDIEVQYSDGRSEKLTEHFDSPEHALAVIRRMLHASGMVLDNASPLVTGHLTRNTRIAAMKSPVVDEDVGVAASIRIVNRHNLSREDLLRSGTATEEMLDWLSVFLRYGISICVAGATSSGKTTAAGWLLTTIPDSKRIFTIENGSRELELVREENGKVTNSVVHTLTRDSENERQRIDQIALVDICLRFNPDILVVGEMRGAEANAAQEAARVGVAVRDKNGDYVPLTGNQLGCVLLDGLLKAKKEAGTLPKNGVFIKTIVTSELARAVAQSYGVETVEVLTGFKFIGEKIKEYEQTGEHTYLFGFEESYGYLVGTHARDKDGVVTCMLLAQTACGLAAQGKTLLDGLEDIYARLGYWKEKTISFTLSGMEGIARIKDTMARLWSERIESFGSRRVKAVRNYNTGVRTDLCNNSESLLDLPKSNVLYYELEGGWACVRPSGTEPKLKVYLAVKGQKHLDRLNELGAKMNALDLESVHFESANGTDLTVGLAEQAVWESAGSKNEKGVPFLPNIPTEEVFTAPHKDKVDGIVYGTKPYVFNGQLIKNFHVTFKDGKVVEHGADEGADLLGQLLDTDEGARHIGEVALVPASSPINRSGKLFYNTLFDENAACHIAFGDSYPGTTVGGTGLSKEELAARGMNHSSLHEDVMVGAEDSRITGKCRDGRTVQLFENGVWVL